MPGTHQVSIMILAAAFVFFLYALGMLAGKVKAPPKKIRRVNAVLGIFVSALFVPVLTPPADRTGIWLYVALATSVLAVMAFIILLFIPGKNESEEKVWDHMVFLYGHTGAIVGSVCMFLGGGILIVGAVLSAIYHDEHLFKTTSIVGVSIMAGTIIASWSYIFYKFVPRNRR